MRKARYYFLCLISLCGVPLLLSCSSNTAPQKTAKELTESGWTKLISQEYEGALDEFDRALVKDPNYSDAYLGAGWVNLFLGESATARTRFSEGKASDTDTIFLSDFYAALGLVSFMLENYDEAIVFADSCLDAVSQYSFDRLPTINSTDLLATKANSYFLLGGDANLSTAAEIITQVIPSLILDPTKSYSWIVDGVTYESFSTALIRALEKVSEVAATT